MPLFRLIAIALAIWIIWFFIRKSVMQAKAKLHKPKSSQVKSSTEDHIVKCETCGLHVPENTAFQKAGKFYCSPEHCS